MKPNEFDELVRQKFDQNDFEYNPRNWDRLEDQLDGRARKRSMIMWWWVPLAGVAASVALAIGIPAAWQQMNAGSAGVRTEMAQKNSVAQPMPQQDAQEVAAQAAPASVSHKSSAVAKHVIHNNKQEKNTDQQVAIRFHDVPNTVAASSKPFNFMAPGSALPEKDAKKKVALTTPGYNTFKPEEEILKPAKTSIILSGGVNRGSMSSGYMASATIRRMLNDKVFIEGDIAYANGDNTQVTENQVRVPATTSRSAGHGAAARSSDDAGRPTSVAPVETQMQSANVTYNASYAQVTPSVGYKLMKRMSVAVGPDFQQMLADNRPASSSEYRGNVQQAPMFDIGFVGKSEYAITKKVKAGVYYRKGVNSVISLNDKYLDRDYLQFQVKCTIFNK